MTGVNLPGTAPSSANMPAATVQQFENSKTVWPIRGRKLPDATDFLDKGYYAGYLTATGKKVSGYWHTGTDMNGPGAYDDDRGNPVFAVRSGVIEWVGVGSGSWGNIIILRVYVRGKTYWIRYAHVQYNGKNGATAKPKAGQIVKAGDVLAFIGKGAGNTFWAHLHTDVIHTQPPTWDNWPKQYAPQSDVTRYYQDPVKFYTALGAVQP